MRPSPAHKRSSRPGYICVMGWDAGLQNQLRPDSGLGPVSSKKNQHIKKNNKDESTVSLFSFFFFQFLEAVARLKLGST